MLVEDRELTNQAAKIDMLLEEMESFPDPNVRAKVADIVTSLLALYGEGLARMLAIIEQEGRSGVLETFARDDLISHLLFLHDLHPVDVETRVLQALEEVRPYLQSHGGNVELIGVSGGVAHLRLQGSCSGCPSSTMTLKLAIEEAIRKAAPELEGIEAEGVAQPKPRPVPITLMPSTSLNGKKKATPEEPAWTLVGGLPQLRRDGMHAQEVAGAPLLFIKLEDTLYAYHNSCPNCGQTVDQGILKGPELACPHCHHQYDVRRAGRSLDSPDLYLEPVPLLVEEDIVRVAMAPSQRVVHSG